MPFPTVVFLMLPCFFHMSLMGLITLLNYIYNFERCSLSFQLKRLNKLLFCRNLKIPIGLKAGQASAWIHHALARLWHIICWSRNTIPADLYRVCFNINELYKRHCLFVTPRAPTTVVHNNKKYGQSQSWRIVLKWQSWETWYCTRYGQILPCRGQLE